MAQNSVTELVKIVPGVALGVILIAVSCSLPFFGQASGDEPPAGGKEAPKELTPAEYLEALSAIETWGEKEIDPITGLSENSRVIPDLYLHGMATAYKELKEKGTSAEQLEKELSKLHKSLVKRRGWIGIHCELRLSDKGFFYFDKEAHAHCEFKYMNRQLKFEIEEIRPKLVYENWIVQETDSKKQQKVKLARLQGTVELRIVIQEKIEPRQDQKIITSMVVNSIMSEGILGATGKVDPSKRTLVVQSWADKPVWNTGYGIRCAEWKLPTPPAELKNLLEKLAK